eukprot:1146537-Pleurochrysis_carterae.AAC.1
MQTTNIPIIDHLHAFATLYNEYVEPSPRVRNGKDIAAPSVPPHTRLDGQTPLLLPLAGTSAALTQTDASCVHAAQGIRA